MQSMNSLNSILLPAAMALSSVVAPCAAAESTTTSAADSATIASRILRHASLSEDFLTTAWRNPAILQFKRAYSFSEVAVAFDHSKQSEAVDVMRGDGSTTWEFKADSYMKYKTSTLWGQAFYQNARTHSVKWNETSDLDMVYPYIQADSIGGKINSETYGFMGGYANFNGRLAWGGTIAYQAGLNYRNVDPRPRNVTANLSASAGLAMAVRQRHLVGAAISFQKYKQTNDIDFYSELGHDKVFHLTGFGNDYTRFAGAGQNTYYNGYRYGAELNFHPTDGHGLSAAASASRFSIDNILTEFNKLPLCHIAHTAYEAEVAWTSTSWGVAAKGNYSRRVGTENVFGDPAGNVYMQIGSIPQYHENRANIEAKAFWQHQWSRFFLGLQPSIAYSHLNAIYASPASLEQINSLTSSLLARAHMLLNGTASLQFTVGAAIKSALNDKWNVPSANTELTGLLAARQHTHNALSGNSTATSASLAFFKAISCRYALKAEVKWNRTGYSYHDISDNQITAQLAFIF